MGLLDTLIGPVTSIIDKIVPDKDQAAKLAHEIATMSEKMANEQMLAQLEVNKAEAASGSLFKGGWIVQISTKNVDIICVTMSPIKW